MDDKIYISPGDVQEPSTQINQAASVLIKAAKAFARSTACCVYIVDYIKREFLYVSENLSILCGISTDKIKEVGINLYQEHVPKEDLKMLLKINQHVVEFYRELPISERTSFTIYYDFHILNGTKKRLVNHRITPMVLTPEGKVWLSLCTVIPSLNKKPGNVKIKKEGTNEYFSLNLNTWRWERCHEMVLSDLEKEILQLSMQGYTMDEISQKVCRSIDSIKAAKKKLFYRLGVRSIVEALSYSINYSLI